jgi:4-amino-4-deoxy-L-arabinose transferase-like glycosyltransferase
MTTERKTFAMTLTEAGTARKDILSAAPPAAIACMVACIGIGFFFLLGGYPLRDNNEGLYAEVAREMLAQRNFIIPQILGVPYIEKPPLLYWMIALSMKVFGVTESSVRLVPAGATAALSFALFLFCRKHAGWRIGFYAVIIFTSAIPIVLISRTVLFDSLLTALLSGALLCFFQWYVGRSRTWLQHGAILLGFAVLAKGGVALILASGIIMLFLCIMRDRKALHDMMDGKAAALFLLVVIPWHVAAASAQEGFLWFYVVNEHLLRFLGMREPKDFHTGPVYYYLARLLVMLLPWTPFSLLALRSADPAQIEPGMLAFRRFCLAWILFPLLFFTISRAKADYYLFVAAPACAILTASTIQLFRRSGYAKSLAACMASAGAICAIAATVILIGPGSNEDWASSRILLLIAIAVIAVSLSWYVAEPLFRHARLAPWYADIGVMGLGTVALFLLVAFLLLWRGAAEDVSSRAVAQWIREHTDRTTQVYVFHHFEDVFSSLPFYLGHSVHVINSTSRDLQFGCRHSRRDRTPCMSFADLPYIAGGRPVAIAVRKSDAQEFRSLTASIPCYTWHAGYVGDKVIYLGSSRF